MNTSAELYRRLSEFQYRLERANRPDPCIRRRDLWSRDVREFGVHVTRRSSTRLTVLEPLSFTAPSFARPYCCYLNTVIFYHHPHRLSPDGRSFLEWERREYLLPWNTIFLFEGQDYKSNAGRVIRHRGGWFMTHEARLRARAPLPASDFALPTSP